MKNIFTLISLLCIVSSSMFAQVPYWFEEILEEKVHDPVVRDYLEQAKIKYDRNESYQKELKAAFEHIQNNTSTALKSASGPVEIENQYEFGFGAEPFIAINPKNENHIVVSYMEQTISGQTVILDMPLYASFDGGNTWTKSSFSVASTLQNLGISVLGGGDPIFSFESDSTVHFTWVTLGSTGAGGLFDAQMAMYYAHSENGGLDFIFSPDTNIHAVHKGDLLAGELIDRQWMDVDANGGQFDGNTYLSALYGGSSLTAPGEIIFVKSPGVNQFTNVPVTAVAASGSNQTQFGNVKVSTDGSVHMTCMRLDPNTQAGEVVYVKSTDGGTTYSTPLVVANATTGLPTNLFGQQAIPSKVHSRENSALSLAVDRDNVYVAWSDMSSNTIKSYLSVSNDGGNTFSAPYEFGVEALGSNLYHLMPNLSASETGLSITWYAVDQNSLIGHYMFLESLDFGTSFVGLDTLSNSSTNFFGMATSQEDFFGDYNASIRKGCATYSVWADGRSGEPRVYMAKVNSCQGAVSIEQTPINSNFYLASLYPNPIDKNTNLTLNLSVRHSDKLMVDILDIQGKQVAHLKTENVLKGDNAIHINLPDFIASGQYLLRLTSADNGVITRKFQVQ